MSTATRIRTARRTVRIAPRRPSSSVDPSPTSALEPSPPPPVVGPVDREGQPVLITNRHGLYVKAWSGDCAMWTSDKGQALVMTVAEAKERLEANSRWRGLVASDKSIVTAVNEVTRVTW